MTTYHYCITGTAPLIMHADNLEAQEQLKQWQDQYPDSSKAGDDRTPPWRWKTVLHTDGEHVVIPCDMLIAALAVSATKIKVGGKGQKTYKKVVADAIRPREVATPLLVGAKKTLVSVADVDKIEGTFGEQMEAAQKLGFRLFVKRAQPPSGRGRHVRVRPRFDKWCFEGTLDVDSEQIAADRLKQILDGCVFGNWTPRHNKPGPFGTVKATIKKLKE